MFDFTNRIVTGILRIENFTGDFMYKVTALAPGYSYLIQLLDEFRRLSANRSGELGLIGRPLHATQDVLKRGGYRALVYHFCSDTHKIAKVVRPGPQAV